MKLTPVSAAVLSVLAASQVHAESKVFSMEEVVVTANKIDQPLSKVAGTSPSNSPVFSLNNAS